MTFHNQEFKHINNIHNNTKHGLNKESKKKKERERNHVIKIFAINEKRKARFLQSNISYFFTWKLRKYKIAVNYLI